MSRSSVDVERHESGTAERRVKKGEERERGARACICKCTLARYLDELLPVINLKLTNFPSRCGAACVYSSFLGGSGFGGSGAGSGSSLGATSVLRALVTLAYRYADPPFSGSFMFSNRSAACHARRPGRGSMRRASGGHPHLVDLCLWGLRLHVQDAPGLCLHHSAPHHRLLRGSTHLATICAQQHASGADGSSGAD